MPRRRERSRARWVIFLSRIPEVSFDRSSAGDIGGSVQMNPERAAFLQNGDLVAGRIHANPRSTSEIEPLPPTLL